MIYLTTREQITDLLLGAIRLMREGKRPECWSEVQLAIAISGTDIVALRQIRQTMDFLEELSA